MDYPWYFPQKNGGGGTIIVYGTDYKTITIPVTTVSTTTECNINDVEESTLGWSVQAIKKENGIAEEIEVEALVTFSPYGEDYQRAEFTISWNPAFNGYINVNYWNKNS